MTARSTDQSLSLITAVRLFLTVARPFRTVTRLSIIAIFFSVFAALLAAEPKRPFLWSDGIRKGNVFKDERLPYSFVAPDDIVFRVWKEGTFYRFEARSYRSETLQIAMTTLRYNRAVPLQSMVVELSDGCAPDTVRIEERAATLQVRCRDSLDGFALLRRLQLSNSNPQLLYYFEIRTVTSSMTDELQFELYPEFRFVLPPE
jgi:hypothetical protein